MKSSREWCITCSLPGYRPPESTKPRVGRKRAPHWHADCTAEQTDAILKRISRRLWKAKNVVVMSGAGISTSCGIPDFRSMNGIYTKDEPPPTSSQCPPSSSAEIISEAAKDGVDAKDLFHYSHVFSGSEAFAEHLRFMGALKSEADDIPSPSATHRLIGEGLAMNGKLAKWLTQNIDGLELRSTESGVCIDLPDDQCGPNASKISSLLVQLHGTVHDLVCARCGERSRVGPQELARMQEGSPMRCKACEAHDARPRGRAAPPRKSAQDATPLNLLRPAVVLYSEPTDPVASSADPDIVHSPSGHFRCRPSQAYDLVASDPLLNGTTAHRDWPDFLLVVGTTLQIPGFQRALRQLARMTRAANGIVVMVNAEDVASMTVWRDHFDYQVLGLADDWAKRVVADWDRYDAPRRASLRREPISTEFSRAGSTPRRRPAVLEIPDATLRAPSFDRRSPQFSVSAPVSGSEEGCEDSTGRQVDLAIARLNAKIKAGVFVPSYSPDVTKSPSLPAASPRPVITEPSPPPQTKQASAKRRLIEYLECLPDSAFEKVDVHRLLGVGDDGKRKRASVG